MGKKDTGGLVYSTETGGRTCPECRNPIDKCTCNQQQRSTSSDGIVRLHRETKGRKGKGVTLVKGLDLPEKTSRPWPKPSKPNAAPAAPSRKASSKSRATTETPCRPNSKTGLDRQESRRLTRNLRLNPRQRVHGILRLGDRPPDHQIITPGRKRLRRRHHPLLIPWTANAGRIPGVTRPISDPKRPFRNSASIAEQTTPSSPDSWASPASRATTSSDVPLHPISRISLSVRLVSTVTAYSSGRSSRLRAAS